MLFDLFQKENAMHRAFLFIVTAALLWGQTLVADTLDFTALPPGDLGTTTAVGGVTIDGTTGLRNQSDQYFGTAGGAICASRGTGANCRGDMNIRFNGKVRKLGFSSAGYQAGDVATILVYRGKNLLGSTGVASNGRVNLSAFKNVTRVKIDYEGVEDGMAFGKFSFTRVTAKHGQRDAATPKTKHRAKAN
jgi:hypothetical protein